MVCRKILVFVLGIIISMVLAASNTSNTILINQNSGISKKEIADYWVRLKKKADKLYSGIDLNVEVSTGIYKRDDALDDNEYNGEIKVKVPIYSKDDKRAKEEKKRQFLDKGAELLKSLEISVNKMGIAREREEMLKAVMLEEGMKSIEAYHKAREEKIIINADIDELVRKLEVMLM